MCYMWSRGERVSGESAARSLCVVHFHTEEEEERARRQLFCLLLLFVLKPWHTHCVVYWSEWPTHVAQCTVLYTSCLSPYMVLFPARLNWCGAFMILLSANCLQTAKEVWKYGRVIQRANRSFAIGCPTSTCYAVFNIKWYFNCKNKENGWK